MDRFQAAPTDNWSDNASPSTSEDCGANSPRDKGYKKRFVLCPDWPNPTLSELNTQQKQFAVTLSLQNKMTEADIRELLMTKFVDLREASFEFVTRGSKGGEYNCPCSIKCHLKHVEGHPSAEWNIRNIRRAARGNRVVYIRKTPIVEAGIPASSNSTQAIKRFCTGEPNIPSEDRTYSVSSDERSCVEVTQLFSELDITYQQYMAQVMKEVAEEKSAEGNCTRDTPDSAYSSLLAESSTAASALSLIQPNSEYNQQIDHEQEATFCSMINEPLQERTDMEEMMEPVKLIDITPEEGDIAGGYKFTMIVNGSLSMRGRDKMDGLFAKFGESDPVPVSGSNQLQQRQRKSTS